MRPDLRQLARGRLVYDEPIAALDDIRFERILRGFADHYDVSSHSGSLFSFDRGEGYPRFERFDAFAYVDAGTVERLRNLAMADAVVDGNLVMMPPRFSAVRFSFNIRVITIFWAFALFAGWALLRGDLLFWGIGFLALYGLHIGLVAASLRRKLKRWLAKESWN